MCDCFHLAFPNWHASATGDGRRLKAPEQDTEDDLICEDPEVLEGERPRPQGSSPVEEFPITEKYVKQGEGDFYDSLTKSSKKGKKIGFGALFDKRSSAKMNQTEDMQNDGSEMIVKTLKGGCAEGLVVSGGGKSGIFIKEVKPESPASKHLSVKEGDQILSATVYFDNVSYEDALQILEHAQPYRLEFCLKRKPTPTSTQEDAETMRPDVAIGEEAMAEECPGPEMRGKKKPKKQHDRISWPKFPSLTKGRRAKFKRSHSTSEAEEQRKLEISPATSDTESPLKSPLKSPDEKDKKKTHKMKLKKKISGRRSKSVEETDKNAEELQTDDKEDLENPNIMNIAEEHSFQESVTNLVDIPNMLDEGDNTGSIKTRNEFTLPMLSVSESLHKAELISLDSTLKTTDITVALGEKRKDRSEINLSIQRKENSEIETESQLKSFSSGIRTSDASIMDNIMASPNIISQEEAVGHETHFDVKLINQEIFEKTQEPDKIDMKIPKIEISNDMSDVELAKKSPMIGGDKVKKERNILETESYGIRTRGPLADIAISSHFANKPNILEFTSSDPYTFEIKQGQEMSTTLIDTKKASTPTPIISQPKPNAQDIKISNLDTDTAELTQKANIDAITGDLGKALDSQFKLPKVDLSEFDQQESTVRQMNLTKAALLKRDDIKIPGKEQKRSKSGFKSPKLKEQKIEKVIKISKSHQGQGEPEEFNVEDVKEAVSKFPLFKLPERDITGVLVQREIAIMEMKTGLTPRGSPCKVLNISTEISKPENTIEEKSPKEEAIISPKRKLHLHDEPLITEKMTDQSKNKSKGQQSKSDKMLARDDKISTSPDVKFKLPKREDIEIPGMEATEEYVQQQIIKVDTKADTQDEAVTSLIETDRTNRDRTEKSNIQTVITEGHDNKDRKQRKAKVFMPSFEIMKPDIRFPDIGIEFPKTTSKRDEINEVKIQEKILLDEEKQNIKSFTEYDTTPITHKVPTKDNKEGKIIAYEPSLDKTEITDKETNMDSSPHKMKLPKLKMPKIGVKSNKGTSEDPLKEDVTKQEGHTIEVVLDSEKISFEADNKVKSSESDKTWSKIKMPSIDLSVPKVKLPKIEGKSKTEEIGFTKPEIDASIQFSKDQIPSDTRIEAVEDVPEDSGLSKFGITSPKEKDGGKTEVKPQAEKKETDSKMKKRKISFPKFGFSKSEIKVSDADISLPTVGSLQEEGADATERDVESKTTEVEAELKDSTDSPTKFRLPAIKLPKFGVSFSKPSDGRTDVQITDVSTEGTTMDEKLPKGSGEMTALTDIQGSEITLSVSKPEAELSLPEEKAEIMGINIPKINLVCSKQDKEIKMSPEPQNNLSCHDIDGEVVVVELSKQEIKAVETSLPQRDVFMPEVKMDETYSLSKDEAEQKDVPIKFKLPTINIPKFAIKTSKVAKDLPMVDIDAEESNVKLPEAQISIKLQDDTPQKDTRESKDGGHSVDINVEDGNSKEQEATFKLPEFGISLSEVKEPDTDPTLKATKTEGQVTFEEDKPEDDSKGFDLMIKRPSYSLPKFGFSKSDPASEAHFSLSKTDASKPAEIKDDEETIKDTKESSAESEKALKGSPTKFKFPKIGVSLPKTLADYDNQMSGRGKEEPTIETKLPEIELPEETNITLNLSKPDVDISMKETEKIDNAQYNIKVSSPEVKVGLAGHGPGNLKDGINVQAQKIETEFDLPLVAEDVDDIPEEKEKESETKLKKLKMSFPKIGFSKSETKVPEIDTSVQEEPITVPETSIKDIEEAIPDPELQVQFKTKSTTGSPSKFKLPTISLPKFNISSSKIVEGSSARADDVEKSKTDVTSVALSQNEFGDSKNPQYIEPSEKHFKSLTGTAEIKAKDTDDGSHAGTFKKTKFEISLPKLKRPESKKSALKTVDIEEKSEGTFIHDMEIQSVDGKVGVSGAGKEIELKVKETKVPTKEHAYSKQDIKAPGFSVKSDGASMTTEEVEVNQPEQEIKSQTKTTSPLKFKLPTLKLPKFGISSSKVKSEVTTDLDGERHTLESEVLASVEMSDGKIDLTVPNQELGFVQPMVDTADISISAIKSGKSDFEDEASKELDSKTMKSKKAGFSLHKLGFSRHQKTDVGPEQVDTCKIEEDVEIKDQGIHIKVSEDEVEQKDVAIDSGKTTFKLPSINLPKIGGKVTKEEKTMSDVDMTVKGPEARCPDKQINLFEPSSIEILEPQLVTEGQTVTAHSNVDDTELEVGKIGIPKLGIDLPKIKGLDLSTSNTAEANIAEANINVQETPNVDVSVQKPNISISEVSVDTAETDIDIKLSKGDSDQKDSTIFGSPTKFKLPSISFPKFGVKSHKSALDIKKTDSEAKYMRIDSSQPEATLEVHPPNIESQDSKKSVDMPAVDSKGLEVKMKRTSFSFPKFGFSKPDITTPELDASIHKIDSPIPESTVHVPDQTVEIPLPKVDIDAEQKELTSVSSPTKFKLPTVNLPKFGIKTSKGTVNLSSEMSVPEPEIKPTIDTQVLEKKETEVSAKISDANIFLAEGNISLMGKADIPVVDPKDLDVKVKKTSFSLPKLGFSKPDIKGQDADVSQPQTDMTMEESNIAVEKQDAEIAQFKMPSISLPKFGIKYPKAGANLQTVDLDIKESEISFSETGDIQTTEIKTNMYFIKGSSTNVDIKTKETDINGLESKFKLPKLGIGMDQTDGKIQDVIIEKKGNIYEIDSQGLKIELPKMGSIQEINATEVDMSLPNVDIGISMTTADVSQKPADIKSPEKEIDLKDDTIKSSPTKFKLPSIHFPKFGIKASKGKVDSPSTNVDIIGPEVSPPDENIKISAKVPTIDIKGPIVKTRDILIEGKHLDIENEVCKIDEFGTALPDTKGLQSETVFDTQENISGKISIDFKEPTSSKELVDVPTDVKGEEESKFKLPKLGISLQKIKSPEIDIDISKTETKEDKPYDKEDMDKTKKSIPEDLENKEDSGKNIKSPEGETDASAKFGSPTKFKLPTIKLPKFGISKPKVTSSTTKADVDITDAKVTSVDIEVETPKIDPSVDIKVKTAANETTSIEANIEAKGTPEGQGTKFRLPKFEVSLPKVKGPEIGLAVKEVKTGTPETGITTPEIVTSAGDVSVPGIDSSLPEVNDTIRKSEETDLRDEKAISGSPSKFKLPGFKMPKFGFSAHKSSDIKAEVTEVNAPDIKIDLNIKDKPIEVSKDIQDESKETTEQAPETVKKKDKDSPSKYKLPSIKMPRINISRTKSQEEDDTTVKVNAQDIKEEPKDGLQGPDKSSSFTIPALGDVLKGFEVEFNVPTLEEMEAQKDKPSRNKDSESGEKVEELPEDKSKFKFKFPKLGFSQSSDESDKAIMDARIEESEMHIEAPGDQKEEGEKEQTKAEKGGWFKFPKFSSPTKTAKIKEKETSQEPEEAEKTPVEDDVEKKSIKEPEKSPMSEIVEENISPTLSLRSSEAFADISSTLTTEQIILSQTSPTKVKVKYAEPTATVGVNDTKVQSDVVTSTARCELISMEPHQPEKVNIPFSSDASTPSLDTFKQMSGEIHVITSNIQAIPDTQQAAIITNLDAQGIHISSSEITKRSDSVLTVEETRVHSATHALFERHIVKETSGDGKETILVTHSTRVFEGDSAEPFSDDTASSIRRLRDTVHTEKMRFFDTVATAEEVTVTRSEISLRHMDSSADENGEK